MQVSGERLSTLRGRIGLRAALALNVTDMVGVGPFLTLPLILAAMGGPPVVLAWVAGAIIALCDALIWSELAASFPEAGGTYAYLRRIFPGAGGRYAAFLFAAQVLISAPLSMASGCVGLGKYLAFLVPGVGHVFAAPQISFWFLGRMTVPLEISGASLAAAAAAVVAGALVYRRIEGVGRIAQVLAAGTLLALVVMIAAGASHFHLALLRQTAPGTWSLPHLAKLLPAGLLIAFYDYWGYYNVAFLGEEVREPRRTLPRAMLGAVALVAVLYVLMNVSVLGVVPWREAASARATNQLNLAAEFLNRTWGTTAGRAMALLVMWTAAASVVALLTGYSRIVFAAARDAALPAKLAKVHRGGFPGNAVLVLTVVTTLFCFLHLGELIAALVVVRIVLQFGLQAVGLLWLRAKHPEAPRPFRMWLYPLPVLLALAGFAAVLVDKAALLGRGAVLAGIVSLFYLVEERRRQKRLVSAPLN